MNTIDVNALVSALNGPAGSASSVPKSAAATQGASVVNVMQQSAPVTTTDMQAAAQQIQSYLSGNTDPPQYEVDYLSGLQVMTVRSASNGAVVFQLPNADALRLAQMLREGSSVSTAGIVDAEA